MPTVDADPSSPSANSYNTAAEVDTYQDDLYPQTGWVSLDSDAKARTVITATRLLDTHLDWLGAPASASQPLAHPRTGLRSKNGASIPSSAFAPELKEAHADLCGRLLKDRTGDAQPDNLKRLEAGSLNLEFFQGGASRKVVPDETQAMLAHLLQAAESGSLLVVSA